jgi:hypothetical protein
MRDVALITIQRVARWLEHQRLDRWLDRDGSMLTEDVLSLDGLMPDLMLEGDGGQTPEIKLLERRT